MTQLSIAGQLALRLEAALAKAGRRGGLATMPASGATCFFEDPLGDVLADAAPRCPPSPHMPKEHQPLWAALSKGSVASPGADQPLHFYEVLGNGIGDREARQRYMVRAAQWVFLHWLHWYQRPNERYATFRHVVLLKTVAQNAPFRRIWSGYHHTLKDLATATMGHANCPLPRTLAKSDRPFHSFKTEPAWVDALSRLATRHEAAGQSLTAAQMLGSEAAARAVPNWSWTAAPALHANRMTVNSKRCSPAAFGTLLDALRFDRWLALDEKINLDQFGQRERAPAKSEMHMNAREARDQTLKDMSKCMSLMREQDGGTMRYAGVKASGDTRAALPPRVRDPAIERLQKGRQWDPEVRLLAAELDPLMPEVLHLSAMHDELLEQFVDPALGLLVNLEVKRGAQVHRGFATCFDYAPAEAGGSPGRGKLTLEIHDVQRLGLFGTDLVHTEGLARWTWQADSALVPATGEPVILLRINI